LTFALHLDFNGVKIAHLRDMEARMTTLPGFLLTMAKAAPSPEKGAGVMSVIIRRPYVFLEKELRSAFKGQEDVKVIVDRRYAERRAGIQPVRLERRHFDRRGYKEELIEVVLSP